MKRTFFLSIENIFFGKFPKLISIYKILNYVKNRRQKLFSLMNNITDYCSHKSKNHLLYNIKLKKNSKNYFLHTK